jgi:hypothetical protein
MSGLSSRIEYMNDSLGQCTPPAAAIAADPDAPVPVPLEHLEARICELAGHLTAATCQFLLLVADFDAGNERGYWVDCFEIAGLVDPGVISAAAYGP